MGLSVVFEGKPVELGNLIGKGATGDVYEAKADDGRPLAIKLLHAHLCNSSEVVSRYAREVTALGAIHHPTMVRIYGSGQLKDGRVFIVMELLVGEPLDVMLRREGHFAPELIVPLLADVCDAAAVAHEAGIVHRDIKPENLFVVRDGDQIRIKLIDFGFVKFTAQELSDEHSAVTTIGSVLGTPGFMSPEQARGLQVDARSDVYALATTVYECLCGELAFDEKSPHQLVIAQATKDPIHLKKRAKATSVSEPLAAAVMRAIEPDASKRTSSARVLASDLRAALTAAAAPSAAKPAAPKPLAAAPSSPKRLWITLTVAGIVLVALALFFVFRA